MLYLMGPLDVDPEQLDTTLIIDEPDTNGLPLLDKAFTTEKSGALQDVNYVATYIHAKNPSPRDAPSSAAWGMLRWARSSETSEAIRLRVFFAPTWDADQSSYSVTGSANAPSFRTAGG